MPRTEAESLEADSPKEAAWLEGIKRSTNFNHPLNKNAWREGFTSKKKLIDKKNTNFVAVKLV